ncbi:FtsX-like permease family protein [Streptomyces sp. SID3343]|uniref:ABC transporter permease n=1 Tax=Streptomyces sp. SID3343 TaxID=2690260 RepID=UPI00136F08F2|nr:FtsX-like permease family protein [Streptomyces sp. SID3343]MYV98574.1 FtsX-like permease family protein [Streptomyces sp. SID3343]
MLKATFRSFLAHKGRMLLSALAVLLSVAFVSGTLVFTDTITKTFDDLFKSTSSDVSVTPKSEFEDSDLAATGQTPTLNRSIIDKIAKIPGVKDAHGGVDLESVTVVDKNNKSVGPSSGAPTLATDWYETDRTPVKITSGAQPKGAGEVMIDADTADKKKVKIGDSLRVIAAVGTFDVKVSGIMTFTATNPGAALLAFDTATASQRLLGNPDLITSVSVSTAAGVGDAQLKERVVQALGPDVEVKTAAESAEDASDQMSGFLDVMKYAMLGFAGVAVLVGIFLIFNTFSMLVAQRTRELGLMRAIGASRADVNRSVLLEAVLLGVVGSTLGLAAGLGLAVGLKALISAVGINLKGTSLVIKAATPITAYVVGVVVTVIAAYVPARRAGKVAPMAALREAGAPPQKSIKTRSIIGAVLFGLGALALVAGATADSGGQGGGFLGLGVLFTLIGFIVLAPLLARTVVPALASWYPKVFGSMGRLSRENALRNPRRTGATASAIMIGVALVSGMAVAASSMSASFDKQIEKSLGADFTVQSMGQPFPEDVVAAAKKTPGIGTFVAETISNAELTAGGKSDKVIIIGTDPGLDGAFKSNYLQGSGDAATKSGKAIVGEDYAKDHNLGLGGKVDILFPNGAKTTVEVGAIRKKDDGPIGFGNTLILPNETMKKFVPDVQYTTLSVDAADGQDAAKVGAALKKSLEPFPQVKARDQSDYKELIGKQIDTFLYLIYGLLGLAIIISILGVINTLALSVVERTREIGLMRAIGASRRQIRRMIRLESMVIAVFGALVGLALGMAWGIGAQRLLASQGLDVLKVPYGTVIGIVVAAAVVGLLAAVMPAFRAARMNVLRAIATD